MSQNTHVDARDNPNEWVQRTAACIVGGRPAILEDCRMHPEDWMLLPTADGRELRTSVEGNVFAVRLRSNNLADYVFLKALEPLL